ncbi:MAG TPA: ChrR family anti-sigma-E factor [Rhizomicrobium sp.]|jgi:putative transcriptional regulator|nr:ChrR family anti-sigma-E factor [Rhizomicrobium sp.]
MIAHHPPIDMLLEYAAGSLAIGPRLVVAAHAALCVDCAQQIGRFDAVGGAMLGTIEPVAISEALLARTMAAIDKLPPSKDEPPHGELAKVLPFPLRHYVDSAARWRWAGPGIDEIELPLASRQHRASLLRIRSGRAMAVHRHAGVEYTVVLAGGFTDGGAHYGVGDLCLAASPQHMPLADIGQDCICLAVLDAPLVLTGRLGRMLNPLLRLQHRRALRRAV